MLCGASVLLELECYTYQEYRLLTVTPDSLPPDGECGPETACHDDQTQETETQEKPERLGMGGHGDDPSKAGGRQEWQWAAPPARCDRRVGDRLLDNAWIDLWSRPWGGLMGDAGDRLARSSHAMLM